MFFKTFKVRNVGPFEDLSLDFVRGSIGIFGPNGCGKSTLVNLMFALITNDFTRFDGVKADCIRNTAEPKTEVSISGEIEHNGETIKITRNFRPTKARPGVEVVIVNEHPITDEPKAKVRIAEFFGVDGKMLDLYVFKAQDRIYDFLVTTPAERARAYATLCRTEACESAWALLGQFLNTDVELRAEVIDNSDELLAEVTSLEQDLMGCEERIAQQQALLLTPKSLEVVTRSLARYASHEQYIRERLVLEPIVASLSTRALDAGVQASKTLSEYQRLEAKQVEDKEAYNAALVVIGNFENYNRQRAMQVELERIRGQLVAQRKALKPPATPAGYDTFDAEATRREEARLGFELTKARQFVAAFAAGVAECPTCGTKATSLEGELVAQRAIIAKHPAKRTALINNIAAHLAHTAALKEYQLQLKLLESREKTNAEALKSLEGLRVPRGNAEDFQKIIDDYGLLELDVEQAKYAWQAADTASTRLAAELETRSATLRELHENIKRTAVAQDRLESMRQRMSEHTAATGVIAHLEGSSEGTRALISDKNRQIKAIRTRLQRSAKLREMAAVVEVARDTLHRDHLPRRVAQTNLARMEGDINAGLSFFGDPFWVETNDQLSFVVHKPGEPPQSAGRLSTGQRVILAMAFWPAVASLWALDLGMLALDEPTASLDDENRRFLGEAVSALTAKVRGSRQIILVTHDHDLRGSFEQVIDLGA